MPKKKKTPSAKKARSPKKSAAPKHDPEWDVLEERFDTVGHDWAALAKMVK